MRRGNHKTVFVVGNGHHVVHLFDLGLGHLNLVQCGRVDAAVDMLFALVSTHGQHALQRAFNRLRVASSEQVGEVLDRNAQLLDVGNLTIDTNVAGVCRRTDRRQRWYIPDHWQGAVFGVQGQCDFPVDCHLVHRALAGGFHPGVRYAVNAGLGDDFGVVRVEEDIELCLVQITVMFDARGGFNTVSIVEQHAEVTNATDACFRADGGLTGFNARVAENAFLGFARFPVVVNLFVGAAADAHAPATAFVLVNQHNTVFLALVDRARRTTGHAGRVQAMLAQPGQVHHESIFELAVDIFLDVVEVLVLAALGKFAAKNFFPVRAPFDLFHALAGDEAAWACGRHHFGLRRRLQMVVIKGEGLVVVVNLR